MLKILQAHLLRAFVANLKIDTIYTLFPESFCFFLLWREPYLKDPYFSHYPRTTFAWNVSRAIPCVTKILTKLCENDGTHHFLYLPELFPVVTQLSFAE